MTRYTYRIGKTMTARRVSVVAPDRDTAIAMIRAMTGATGDLYFCSAVVVG